MDLVKIKQQMDEKELPKASEVAEKITEKEQIEDIKTIEKKSKPKQKIQRRITFPVTYEDLDSGKQLKGMVSSKIMDSTARLRYDQVLITLTGGHPFDDFPQAQKTRFQCLARIICQTEDVEQWILEKAGEDLDFCFLLASKLVEHENRYFRYYDAQDDAEAPKSRFSVDFPDFEEV